MRKGANAPERVLFDRVIKKRKKRTGKKSPPRFKWITTPAPATAVKKPSVFSKIKSLIGK